MKYIAISQNETLSSLTDKVGSSIVDQIIADNGLTRAPNIGQQWVQKCDEAKNSPIAVEPSKKVNILNQYVQNSDIYEKAALLNESNWKVLRDTNSFPNYLYISDQLEDQVVDSYEILGNKISVPPEIYNKINQEILENSLVDGSVFNTFSSIQNVSNVVSSSASSSSNPLGWFKIPETEVLLYSSLSNDVMSIPAYPENLNDSRSASYTTMPDLLYQYEPWQLYQGSGPRSGSYEFHLHRDMWTGDHSDGKANELIRFCEAQCFPQYNGSAVNTSTVSLYIKGENFITGIMTDVKVEWTGPIGKDGFYLEFTLTLDITEVSKEALNYDTILSKPLIG